MTATVRPERPVVTLGETMVLFQPLRAGSLATVTEFRLTVGGAESNVAIALSRLGTPAAWIGRVGADALGERVVRELRAENVRVEVIVGDGATGLMVKERRTAETARISYYRAASAGSRLSPADVPVELVRGAALLHVTGITPALSESAYWAVLRAIDVASQAGVPVSFDVNHRASLWADRDASAVYREIARRSTLVFAGEEEAALLCPGLADVAATAAAIADLGPSHVLIKRGARGCFARVDGVEHSVPAVAVRVVDTVGAGDAFVAGYLSELVAGTDVQARLTTAVTAGAFACLGEGDWEGMPRRRELGLLDGGEPVSR